jgi:hypothetical protein
LKRHSEAESVIGFLRTVWRFVENEKNFHVI